MPIIETGIRTRLVAYGESCFSASLRCPPSCQVGLKSVTLTHRARNGIRNTFTYSWEGLDFPSGRWPTFSPIEWIIQAKRDLIAVIKSRIPQGMIRDVAGSGVRKIKSPGMRPHSATCGVPNGLRCGVLCWIHAEGIRRKIGAPSPLQQ